MNRIHAIIGVLVLIGGLCFASAATARQPNILLILADDVGREVLGCYGGTSYETPEIDRLAAEGMRFEHAYTMPVCHPTRIALLTAQYPFRLAHPEWGTFPPVAEHRTLSNLLKRAGYATAVAGKWQLALLKDDVEQPHRMGFDEYCLYGWHEGPWYYEPHIRQNGKLRDDVRDRYGPDVVCEFLMDFIERKRDQPFFAFYSMSLCHAETNDLVGPPPFGPHGRYDSYAEMAPKMDERVGRVVAKLEELGLRESTLVLFFSDNGTARRNLIDYKDGEYVYEDVVSKMGDREIRGGKSTLTDGGTRVPLIANWPGKIQPGQVSDMLVDVTDFLPSLCELAGAARPAGVTLDGYSIPAQINGQRRERPWVFAEHDDLHFVRNQRWKLYSDGRFYDMQHDTDETRPLREEELSKEATSARSELVSALNSLEITPAE